MSDSDLDRVKRILNSELSDELKALQAQFNEAEFSQHVADVLAEAMQVRASRDDKISNVLAPTIDQAIAGSIDQDPKKLAESLYPIMGPAIRKSISETLQQMLENFNQLLEESLSPKSLRWRFDAWRTGRSYSELVMLNTLEYRIEQIFLIHRETSLLIQHQFSELADTRDPDMVSSMFSAIQDFIEDSFSTDETNELNTLRLGDLTVVIQRGPSAVLAGVVRGRVPENLRLDMTSLLETMHITKRAFLSDYSGDPSDFADIEPDMQRLLQAEKKAEEKRKIPWLALVSIAVLMVLGGYWQWQGSLIEKAQLDLVSRVNAISGVVVLDTQLTRNAANIRLLMDPDAEDPMALNNELPGRYTVSYDIISYISTEDKPIEQRAKRILDPETNVELVVLDQVIYLKGSATLSWIARAESLWPGVAGAEGIDTGSLSGYDPEMDRVMELKSIIENFVFDFEKGDSEIDSSTPQFVQLIDGVSQLLSVSDGYGISISVDIVGYTDESGSEIVNRRIGLQRANAVRDALILQGIDAARLSAFHGFDYESKELVAERKTRLIAVVGREE